MVSEMSRLWDVTPIGTPPLPLLQGVWELAKLRTTLRELIDSLATASTASSRVVTSWP